MDIRRVSQHGFTKNKTRKKKDHIKFVYIDKHTKKIIRNKKILEHIAALNIPPAYKKVVISSKPRSKVQAIGTDDKGRRQYIYSPTHLKNQNKEKFSELIIFGQKIKRIRADMKRIIRDTSLGKRELLSKESLISLVLYLVDNCQFRIGCQKYKILYKTYGVTTLNKSHFKKINNNMNIEFVGKKGVVNKAIIKNQDICSILDNLCKRNRGDYLFNSFENGKRVRITEKHINDYLKKYNKIISVKMFRTWKANYILLREMLEYPLPENTNDSKKNVREIIKKAAEKMHHTKGVSKKSYMNNQIINLYSKHPTKFRDLIASFRKKRALPSIDRILNLMLQYFMKE